MSNQQFLSSMGGYDSMNAVATYYCITDNFLISTTMSLEILEYLALSSSIVIEIFEIDTE
ncbi:MAG: hypothetical protein M3M84_05980 [Thermoproteota archaeon]|nr:hypothetical protein [Thermoproteota archaeon]